MGYSKPIVGVIALSFLALALSGCLFPEDAIFLTVAGGRAMVDGLGTTMSGFVGWEPYPSEAVVKGRGKILMNSSEIWPHHPCCVLVYRDNWFKDNEDAGEIVKRVVWAHMQAQNWINEAKGGGNYTELVKYAGIFTHREEEVVKLALDNVDYDYTLDIEGIKEYGNGIYDKTAIINSKKWKASGYESMDDYIDDVVDESFIDSNYDPGLNLTKKGVKIGFITDDLHHLPLQIIRDVGFDRKVNISITTDDRSNGVGVMMDLIKNGEVDMAYLGIAPALIHGINSNDFSSISGEFNDAKIEIVAGVNYNGSAIVVEEGINNLEDLVGKTVGYPGEGTVQWYLILKAVEKEKLKIST